MAAGFDFVDEFNARFPILEHGQVAFDAMFRDRFANQ